MKTICIVFFCLMNISLYAKPNVTYYQEYEALGFALYADNHEICPVYVQFDFTLRNLRVENKSKAYFVIPPKSVRFKITNLLVVSPLEDFSFTYIANTNFGNPEDSDYDGVFQYYLPFKKGEAYKVKQGYEGAFSHLDTYAIDFDMPEGTEIYAARGGMVVNVEQSHEKSCKTEACAKDNNFILIYHNDGTFAEYSHIKHNGSLVKKGDMVKIGQAIGYSGNVGWSDGPHLHFEVYLPKPFQKERLKTNFLTGDGSDYSILAEYMQYTRDY
ncbi:peptidase M23-like protein [Ulvibacter sp. MAR_2010_11]|uniref:M23 family metallopeptidase n=1 Tax=Ulvibacter sp. MAR_2010_11 TaxID=1250229 RepID=UPI000C2C2DD0|nr:M23 family metallopeptidase [Ulvibacter sp. MAR_2010_11]PKA83340.1 peptidase M23-like protein [Ulvibacter sp. MAR_2010_11]